VRRANHCSILIAAAQAIISAPVGVDPQIDAHRTAILKQLAEQQQKDQQAIMVQVRRRAFCFPTSSFPGSGPTTTAARAANQNDAAVRVPVNRFPASLERVAIVFAGSNNVNNSNS